MSNAQRKLRVGVVGLGRMGQRHALNILHKCPRASLLGVCSPAESDLSWGAQNLKAHGVELFRSIEEMVQMPELEAVVIASNTALHMEHTLVALDQDLHVLCEKPVCTSAVEVCRGHPLRA